MANATAARLGLATRREARESARQGRSPRSWFEFACDWRKVGQGKTRVTRPATSLPPRLWMSPAQRKKMVPRGEIANQQSTKGSGAGAARNSFQDVPRCLPGAGLTSSCAVPSALKLTAPACAGRHKRVLAKPSSSLPGVSTASTPTQTCGGTCKTLTARRRDCWIRRTAIHSQRRV